MVSDQTADEVSNTNGGEKTNGEPEYVELLRGSDGHKVSVGDTVWVDVDARAEREDPDERDWAPRLIDEFEAEVVEVRESELVLGGKGLELELDNGDRISIGNWYQFLDRDYEHYCHEGRDRMRVYVEVNDEPEVATDGGVDVAEEPDIDDIHERVQESMRPYADEILEGKYTSIFAEDDENWYLSVHWGEWDALLSDDIITSEEHDAISSEYHSIVSDKWRNDDPENRWSNAAPYGDGYALVLEKPEGDEGDRGDRTEIVCRRCSGTVVENMNDRFEAGDEVTHFVRCIDCGEIGWVRIIDEQVAELVDVVRPDDYNHHSALLADPTPVDDWIGDWRQSAIDAGVIDEPEVVTDEMADDDELSVSGSVRISSGESVDADAPVDATASQMVIIDERAEVIEVFATIVRESDAELNSTLIDMLDEIADQSDAIRDSARDIMATCDEADELVTDGGVDVPEVSTDGGEKAGTARDRAWLAVIDLLAGAQPMTVRKIADGGNVHENTARAVLHVAEAYGVLSREKEHSHTYEPTIGPLGDVTDPEYRRAIRTLIAEAKQED